MENLDRRLLLAGLGLVGAAAAASANAGSLTPPPGPVVATGKTTDEIEPRTPIATAPLTIAASGSYYLTGNLTVAAGIHAITINAPNVTIDLNGFSISGPLNLTTSIASCVLVNNVGNVTIRNGFLINMGNGVTYTGSSPATNYGQLLENVTFAHCYSNGVAFNSDSPGSVIRNCTFNNIGGSTTATNTDANAIYAFGGMAVLYCTIGTVTARGTGVSCGINGLSGSCYIGNTIMNCTVGIVNGKYQNNLTGNVTTPFLSGTNAGGNN